jgi:hypothetical protein
MSLKIKINLFLSRKYKRAVKLVLEYYKDFAWTTNFMSYVT